MRISPLSPILLAGCLFGAGCGATTTPPSPEQPQHPAAQEPAPTQASNCDHPYYPLKLGTKTSYRTSAAGRVSTFQWEVREATNDHAMLHYSFDGGMQMDSEMSCGDDGLLAKTYLDLSSAMAGGDVEAKTISSSGHFLPRDLAVGTTWTSTYEVEAKNNNPQAAQLGMSTTHMNLTTKNTAVSEEQVTVPAGTFSAIKVESNNKMKMKLGPNLPDVDTEFTSYSYFVRGKGLVKSEILDSHSLPSGGMEATDIITP